MRKPKKPARVFCTSFCNHGHDINTGKPINHGCYILPPKALEAEREGDTDKASEIIKEKFAKKRVYHRGVTLVW